ncbi:MAG: hypothetical protein U5L95_04175 [Candidatus Saccharibacteria bacterium]|nr:hypothetical protein [Candidatus Saccharibacteria bacterium]
MSRFYNSFYEHRAGVYNILKSKFQFVLLGLLSSLFLVLGIVALSSFTSANATPETEQVVLQSDFANSMNTWTYHDDTVSPFVAADPNPTANHQIAANPTPTPGDNGAVKLTSGEDEKWNLASLQYSGTKLEDITALGFSLYTNNPGKAYINLDVDFNHDGFDDAWQGRLVYVPSGVTPDTWDEHEAVASDGSWKWSTMITEESVNEWPDGDTSESRSWSDITAAFPAARVTAINNLAFGSLYLRADGTSTTYYDHVYLATDSEHITYNFELPVPDAPTPINPESDTNPFYTDSAFTQSWSDESASGAVEYEYQSCYQTSLPATDECPGGVTTWENTYTGTTKNVGASQPDSHFFWHIRSVDAAGNTSSWSDWREIVIDNTSPAQVLGMQLDIDGTIKPCGAITNMRDITVDWDDSTEPNLKHYEYQADANKTAPYEFTTTVNSSERSGTIRDQDGTYNYRVRAIDQVGNVGTWSGWCSITLDRVAPLAAITSHTDGETVNGNITLIGEVTDENPMNTYFRIEEADGTVIDTSLFTDGRVTHEFGWDTAAVADDTYSVFFETRDEADNKLGSRGAPNDSVVAIELIVNNTVPGIPDIPSFGDDAGGVSGGTTGGPGGGDDGDEQLILAQNFAAPGDGGQVLGQNTGDDNDEDDDEDNQDQNNTDNGEVLQSTTDDNDDEEQAQDDECAKLFGVCWYWWGIPVVAILIYMFYRLAHQEDEK